MSWLSIANWPTRRLPADGGANAGIGEQLALPAPALVSRWVAMFCSENAPPPASSPCTSHSTAVSHSFEERRLHSRRSGVDTRT
jgi:hypothetical protein